MELLGWRSSTRARCAVRLAPGPGSAACRGAAWPVAGGWPRARSDAALAAGEEAWRGHWRAGEEALRWRGEEGRSS
jgi:hypothetical protein